jgi:hypothetical protein
MLTIFVLPYQDGPDNKLSAANAADRRHVDDGRADGAADHDGGSGAAGREPGDSATIVPPAAIAAKKDLRGDQRL